MVNQALYPNGTRLYTYWTADGYQRTGCFNILCPGFIQVSSDITLGMLVEPTSTYNGAQYEMIIASYQERTTLNWWFMCEDKYVGYWPKEIFTFMADGANFVSWGGDVYSPINELIPAMGSGHFPQEGYGKAAYVNQIKVVYKHKDTFEDPIDYGGQLSLHVDTPFFPCQLSLHLRLVAGIVIFSLEVLGTLLFRRSKYASLFQTWKWRFIN